MKKIFMILMILFVCGSVFATGAVETTSDGVLATQTEQAMQEMNAQIGMPAIKNFQERKLAKMIFELRDQENLATYAYIVAQQTGRLVFIGECIGYGLPYSVQYTSPEKLVDRYGRTITSSNYDAHPMPQADPNGLFMPSGLSATWLMLVDPKTKQARPVYVEPEIIVSPFPLH